MSCALVLQLLLVGLAFGGGASASASGDPFAICYGDGGSDADHDPDRKSGDPVHCLLACARLMGAWRQRSRPPRRLFIRRKFTLRLRSGKQRLPSPADLALRIPREALPKRDRFQHQALITFFEECSYEALRLRAVCHFGRSGCRSTLAPC